MKYPHIVFHWCFESIKFYMTKEKPDQVIDQAFL